MVNELGVCEAILNTSLLPSLNKLMSPGSGVWGFSHSYVPNKVLSKCNPANIVTTRTAM